MSDPQTALAAALHAADGSEARMTEKRYDRDLLAYKIRWEGGVMAALDYGLRADDIGDPDLRAAWQRLQGLHEELRPLVREFERRLGTARPDDGVHSIAATAILANLCGDALVSDAGRATALARAFEALGFSITVESGRPYYADMEACIAAALAAVQESSNAK